MTSRGSWYPTIIAPQTQSLMSWCAFLSITFLQSTKTVLLGLCSLVLNILVSHRRDVSTCIHCRIDIPFPSTSISRLSVLQCWVLIHLLHNERWAAGSQLTHTSGQRRGENELRRGWIKHVSEDAAPFHRSLGLRGNWEPPRWLILSVMRGQTRTASCKHSHLQARGVVTSGHTKKLSQRWLCFLLWYVN